MRHLHPLLLILLFWQCHDEATISTPETTSATAISQEFSMKPGNQLELGGKDKLHLTLQSLTDSRCPANAICIHYGSASVVLTISDSQGKTENMSFCIGSCGSGPFRDTHTVTTQSGNTTYKITLKEVQPFPGLEKPGDEKKAVFFVER